MASNPRNAIAREVFWMAAAMINARDNAAKFNALLDLVREWPEAKICALADRLAPTPGLGKDRNSALAAIQGFSLPGSPDLHDRISRVSEEVALVFTKLGSRMN